MKKDLDEIFIYPKSLVDDDAIGFASTVRDWANKEIISRRLEYQKNYDKLFVEKSKKLFVDIGLEKILLPEGYGGIGWNSPSRAPGMLLIFSEVGRADATTGFIGAIKCASLAVISMQPNDEKRTCDALIPHYFAKDLKNVALILPGAGVLGQEAPLFLGRSVGVNTHVTKRGHEVTGKDLRPMGPAADAELFCVASCDKEGKSHIVFVPSDAEGVTKGMPLRQTGLNACRNTDVSFDKVDVPREYLIQRGGAIEGLYPWLNLLLGGVSIGAAMNFYEILADWSENRTIKGGGLLKENPLCASVLADVAEEIATARLMSFSLAHIIAGTGERDRLPSTMTYPFSQMIGSRIQQSALKALNRGMELMGSAGYAKEWHVEKHWRDIKTIQSYLCGVGAEAPIKLDLARFFYDCREV